jgi:hypothetical protein
MAPRKPVSLPFEYLQVGPVRIQTLVDSPAVALNLHTIQDQLGAASIGVKHYTEGEEERFQFVCYRGGSASKPFVLIVASDEMGGPELGVRQMTVARPTVTPMYAEHCSAMRDSTWTAVTDRGIRLGMERREVEKILGARRGQKVSYEVFEEQPSKTSSTCDPVTVSSELDLLYKNNILVSLKGLRDDYC